MQKHVDSVRFTDAPNDIEAKLQFLEEQRLELFAQAAMVQLNKHVQEFTPEELSRFQIAVRNGNSFNQIFVLTYNDNTIAEFFLHYNEKRATFEYHRKMYLPDDHKSERVH